MFSQALFLATPGSYRTRPGCKAFSTIALHNFTFAERIRRSTSVFCILMSIIIARDILAEHSPVTAILDPECEKLLPPTLWLCLKGKIIDNEGDEGRAHGTRLSLQLSPSCTASCLPIQYPTVLCSYLWLESQMKRCCTSFLPHGNEGLSGCFLLLKTLLYLHDIRLGWHQMESVHPPTIVNPHRRSEFAGYLRCRILSLQ